MRAALVVFAFAFACSGRHEVSVDLPKGSGAITAGEADTLANLYSAAAFACDRDRLDAMIDRDGFRARAAAAGAGDGQVDKIDASVGVSYLAQRMCTYVSGAKHYVFLHLRGVGSELHPILRRSSAGVTYHELALVRSRDGRVRIADLYSYYTGEWSSAEAAFVLQTGADDPAKATWLLRARNLETSAPAQALAILDQLPPGVRASRFVSLWRVAISQRISQQAYAAALNDVAQRYPDDPSVALIEIDGAWLRGDIEGALHELDLVDQAIGPDAFLDGLRAMFLVARNHPGDVDAAGSAAERAAREDPGLPAVRMAKLAVECGRKQWSAALADVDALAATGSKLDPATLGTNPIFKELVTTPEFAAWRANH
jgi:hypothetical protein